MQKIATLIVLVALTLSLTFASHAEEHNALTAEQKAQGWKLLFDGKTLAGWHSFKEKQALPEWSVADGVLKLTPVKEKHNPGLVTNEMFEHFELYIEWKISPGGNSGVFYRVQDEGNDLNNTGIECQVLDNEKHPDAKVNKNRQSGAAYYMYEPAKDATKPVGEWNQLRIVVTGQHVEHYLNNEKVVDYTILSEDWLKRFEASKFKKSPKYGRIAKGHIALQEHGDAVEYRDIRIREIEAPKTTAAQPSSPATPSK